MTCLLTIKNELRICERKNLLCVRYYQPQKDVYFSFPNGLILKKTKQNKKNNQEKKNKKRQP